MKILQLLPYLPAPATFGGAMRMHYIRDHLCRHHDVTVAGYAESGDLALFRSTFPSLEGRHHFINRPRERFHRLNQIHSLFTPHSYWYNWAQSDLLQEKLNRLVDREEFDIILSAFATMGHFNFQTDALRIVDAHNVEYDNFRRMSQLEWSPLRKRFYRREYERCYREETAIFRKQDAIFATSERDSALIGKTAPDVPRYVIPNGVDTGYFSPTEGPADPKALVFTGAMSYVPNYDGIIHFLEHIFPLVQKRVPGARIYVVGSNPPPILLKYRSPSVFITGFVEDVRPYIDRAAVYVVPLRMGSGTRLKVVEALAMKKAIVSTSIGSEGIDVMDNEHLLLRDDPESFASAVVKLIGNRSERDRLASNGYELVRKRYDWNVIGDAIEQAFHSLAIPTQWG